MAVISLLFLLILNRNDLLSNVDTKTYWELKNIKVTEKNMQAYLKPLDTKIIDKYIQQLNSSDKKLAREASKWLGKYNESLKHFLYASGNINSLIRSPLNIIKRDVIKGNAIMRLMAIKTLGELKSKDSLPLLYKISRSNNIWEIVYTKEAIEKITGKKNDNNAPSEKKLTPWLITENTIMIGQANYNNVDFNLFSIFDRKIINKQDFSDKIKKIKKRLTTALIKIIEEKGNLKIENFNFSIDQYQGSPWDTKYAITIALKGIFTDTFFSGMLNNKYGYFNVYTSPNTNVTLTQGYLHNNKRLLVIRIGNYPKDSFNEPQKLIRSLKYGNQVIKNDPVLSAYFKKINPESDGWFAGILPEELKKKHPFNLIQNISGEGYFKNDSLKGRLLITTNAADTDKLINIVKNKIRKSIESIKSYQKQLPDNNLKLRPDEFLNIKKIDNGTSAVTIQIDNVKAVITHLLYGYVFMFNKKTSSPVIHKENEVKK